MAYTIIASVRTATGFSDTDNISDALITAYIADADGIIDAHIGDVYTLPLSETPEIIETISRHIVTALLYANEYGEESEDTDKGWKDRMKWVMGLLDDIRKNKLKLRDSTGEELSRSTLRQPGFKPTNSSSLASAEDSDQPKMTMNQEF